MMYDTASRRSRSKVEAGTPIQDFNLERSLPARDGIERLLLCVGDFSTGSRASATKLAEDHLKTLVPHLEQLGLQSDPGFFLETLASLLNDFLLGFKEPGQVSHARCTVVFALVEGDRCHYLSVGDARLAVVRGDRILLPLGADWHSPRPLGGNDPAEEKRLGGAGTPAFLGADFADGPPATARSLLLLEDDVLLLYSDGLESVRPSQRLEAVLGHRRDPKGIADALVERAAVDDDVLVTVVVGPFPRHDPLTEFGRSLGQKANANEVATISGLLNTLTATIQGENGLDARLTTLQGTVTTLSGTAETARGLSERVQATVSGGAEGEGLIARLEKLEQVTGELAESSQRSQGTLTKLERLKPDDLGTRLEDVEKATGALRDTLGGEGGHAARIKGLEDSLKTTSALKSGPRHPDAPPSPVVTLPDAFLERMLSMESHLAGISGALQALVATATAAGGAAVAPRGAGTDGFTKLLGHTSGSRLNNALNALRAQGWLKVRPFFLGLLFGVVLAYAVTIFRRGGSDPGSGGSSPADTTTAAPTDSTTVDTAATAPDPDTIPKRTPPSTVEKARPERQGDRADKQEKSRPADTPATTAPPPRMNGASDSGAVANP